MITNPKKLQLMLDKKEALDMHQEALRMFARHPEWDFMYDWALEALALSKRYDERIKAL